MRLGRNGDNSDDVNMSEDRKIVRLKWLHTSDMHANLFGCDYRNGTRSTGGVSAVYSYICRQRKDVKERLIITDGGDNLQGQPLAYYYNFVETKSPHLVAEVMNEMGYVCSVMGNHDIEVGEETFERWMGDCNFPILGANVIDKRTGKPYLKPYLVFHREGIKIVVLGLVTTAIKYYQPSSLWPHLEFEDMIPCAKLWVETIQKTEHPDVLVGVFHSGFDGGFIAEDENAVKDIAEQVPGFDMICYGHDHQAAVHTVTNIVGNEVVCMSAACAEGYFAEANIDITIADGVIESKAIHAAVHRIKHIHKDELLCKYDDQIRKVAKWASQPICQLSETMDEREAYRGPNSFLDQMHLTQLEMIGANISLMAPCSYNSCLKRGELRVKDLFPLMEYEEFVYRIRISGDEIIKMLEYSYGMWINTILTSQEHLLQIHNRNARIANFQKIKRIVKRLFIDHRTYNWRFIQPSFQMYVAAGICYTVDVTKPEGNRVSVLSLSDGSTFDNAMDYEVAVSRRLLWDKYGPLYGIGLSYDDVHRRIIDISERALPYYLMHKMAKQKNIQPRIISTWKFIPEELVKEALDNDTILLFPNNIVKEFCNSLVK